MEEDSKSVIPVATAALGTIAIMSIVLAAEAVQLRRQARAYAASHALAWAELEGRVAASEPKVRSDLGGEKPSPSSSSPDHEALPPYETVVEGAGTDPGGGFGDAKAWDVVNTQYRPLLDGCLRDNKYPLFTGVLVNMTVNPNGRVDRADISIMGADSRAFNCMRDMAHRLEFPATGKATIVRVPVHTRAPKSP